ncbi:EF-hand domain-containing protein [Yoonia sediminilitoris]|uniref:EF hand domain-containing protein n=1 Tax=Yoonia sediminilitoris TaxID=1286148 RepID=A0A2T6KPX6_9RHOB|nr:EF-hand domain-containing protein [Yoonia sediminilitoris]PUB18613.1 hypothetical protein C8N45_101197 [Yoonia sediminilitoris]RCW98781.1 hypothetical protein DFP92_101197 [Yoonia sediminilitoris]
MMKQFLYLALPCAILPQPLSAQQGPIAATSVEVDAWVAADGNTDARLDRTEFEVFVRAMAETGQTTARQIRMFGAFGFAFGIADKDNDGFVSPGELRAADDNHRDRN